MVHRIGPSVGEDGQIEPLEARWVGDHVDLGNLLVLDREAEGEEQLSTRGYDDAHPAVDERRSCESCPPRGGERLFRHGSSTAELCRRARWYSGAVGSAHDVGGEHREERLEVTAA